MGMTRGPGFATTLVSIVLALAGCQPAAEFPGDRGSSEAGPPPPAAVTDSGTVPPAPPPATDTATPVAAPMAPPEVPAGDCRVAEPGPRSGTRRIAVFFTCADEVRPVGRIVDRSPAVLRSALEALLRGPTAAERGAGYRSFFAEATAGTLNRVAVGADGLARIDFDDFSAIIPNASSSAGSEQLLGQLRATIFQYPTVRAAEITFAGSCEKFWNWLQRSCETMQR